MKVGKWFTLAEFLRTSYDVDGDPTTGFMVDNKAPKSAINNIKVLTLFGLDRIRDRWGPLRITSGYRSPALNTMAGGVADSAHIYGCAADIVPLDPNVTVEMIWNWLPESGLQYDQAIWEISRKGNHWLHYGITRPGHKGPRLMHFKKDMR